MKTFLFWFQVVMAWIYTAPQIYAILSGHTKGLTLAMYAIFIVYLALSLLLAVASYRINRDATRKQTVIIFSQWVILIGLILVCGLRNIIWSQGDTIICIAITILSAITVIKYRGLNDPISKGLLATWCKAAPQLWLTYVIISAQSADGLPLITLVAGHLTSIPRLVQIYLAGHSGGWDRPTKGLMIGESSNVITWVAVTIVWFVFR